jgi:hypothetical protein
VTFLTTRTAWVTSEDWVKGCVWWKTSTLLPVNVRLVKNVTCLSSLIVDEHVLVAVVFAKLSNIKLHDVKLHNIKLHDIKLHDIKLHAAACQPASTERHGRWLWNALQYALLYNYLYKYFHAVDIGAIKIVSWR